MAVLTNPYTMLLDEEHRILSKTRDLRGYGKKVIIEKAIANDGMLSKTHWLSVII